MTPKPCFQQELSVELKAKPISFPGLEEDNGKGTERKRRKEHVGQMCASPLPLSEPWGRCRTPVVREVKGGVCGSWRLSEAHKDRTFQLFLHYTFIPLVAQCCSGARAQGLAFLGFPRWLMESVTLELAWNLVKHGEVLTAKTGQEPQSLEPADAKWDQISQRVNWL